MFATILYYMIGLANRDEAGNFFVYLSLLLVFSILMSQQLAAFAAFADSGTLTALSACTVLLLILFGGFIVPPNSIPDYYTWIYWWNPSAWIYRGLILNEFWSNRWEDPDTILTNIGFIGPGGEPFGREWIGYAFAFALPYSALCTVLTALALTFVRNACGKAVRSNPAKPQERETNQIEIPFKPVTLSFRNICYEVTASTSKETLFLLKNVNGILRAGHMTALMGSSGAGKTTLMVRTHDMN